TKSLAATILVYAMFTGAAAFSTDVWMLAIFRFLAGIGVGGEWAMAGTYVAEAWPEDRRKMGAGYLQTGYYFGFFVAAALNYTIGATFGWRAMFVCGLVPVVVSIATLLGVKEEAQPLCRHLQPSVCRAHCHHVGTSDDVDRRAVGGRGLRADGDHLPLARRRNGPAERRQNGVLRHWAALDRNDPGLHRRPMARRTARPPADARPLLSWHDGHDRRRLRLGVLPADLHGAADLHDDPVLHGFVRR